MRKIAIGLAVAAIVTGASTLSASAFRGFGGAHFGGGFGGARFGGGFGRPAFAGASWEAALWGRTFAFHDNRFVGNRFAFNRFGFRNRFAPIAVLQEPVRVRLSAILQESVRLLRGRRAFRVLSLLRAKLLPDSWRFALSLRGLNADSICHSRFILIHFINSVSFAPHRSLRGEKRSSRVRSRRGLKLPNSRALQRHGARFLTTEEQGGRAGHHPGQSDHRAHAQRAVRGLNARVLPRAPV
jgi:hypothetical protein